MKSQQKLFVVEIRQRRGMAKQPSSIWGDVDLTAATAETERSSQPDVKYSRPAKPQDDRVPTPRILQSTASAPRGQVVAVMEDSGPSTGLAAETSLPPAASIQASPVAPAKRTRRARRRNADDMPLPRGQRWKRRLSKVLR